MHTWAKPNRKWFEWPLLAVKIGVVLVVPALGLYQNALSRPHLLWPYTVNELMKGYEAPAAIACSVATLVLLVAGVVEWLHRRRKQAVWDLGFAALAILIAIELYGSLGVKVR
jgi:hypothetical protein